MSHSLAGKQISTHLSKQTVRGAINSNPVFDQLRKTEGAPKKTTTYVQANEVRTDRQAREQIKDSSTYDAELSFDYYEQSIPYLIDAIQGVEVTNSVTDITIAATATGITDSANGFTFIVGDYVFSSNFATSSLNRSHRVTAATSGEITLSPAPATTESAGATVTIQTRKTSSGSTIAYYTGQTRTVDETKAGDLDYFTPFDGIMNDTKFEISETGIMNGSSTVKFESPAVGTAIVSGQTDNSLDTSSTISNITGVTKIWIDGLDTDPVCTIKSMGFEFSNNLIEDRAAACEGAEYGNGEISLSGALVARNRVEDSLIWRDKYNNGTDVAIAVEIDHGGGKHTIIEIPNAKITDHTMPDGSNVLANSDMTYTAQVDSRGFSCAVYRDW